MNYYKINKKRNILERASNLSVTTWIIIITVLISVICFLITFFNPVSIAQVRNPLSLNDSPFLDYIALKPANILQGKFLWTLILHIFVHGGLTHLLINMFVLYSLGRLTERIIGRKRFFWFYVLSGIFAGILSVLLSGLFGSTGLGQIIFGSPAIFMVGASGAIFAIAGLYVVLLPRLRFMIIFLPFFSLPAYIMIPLMLFGFWIFTIALGAATGFFIPVGNVAHFGGFLAGIIYGSYLKSKYKNKIHMLQKMFR